VHVQTVGLNAETNGPASSRRGDFSLDIPFYRTCPVSALIRTYLPKNLQQPANILDAWSEVMMTQIAAMLAVSDGNGAIDFYKAAFGAQLLWHLGGGGGVVAPGQL
jgi:hypothetical protein